MWNIFQHIVLDLPKGHNQAELPSVNECSEPHSYPAHLVIVDDALTRLVSSLHTLVSLLPVIHPFYLSTSWVCFPFPERCMSCVWSVIVQVFRSSTR